MRPDGRPPWFVFDFLRGGKDVASPETTSFTSCEEVWARYSRDDEAMNLTRSCQCSRIGYSPSGFREGKVDDESTNSSYSRRKISSDESRSSPELARVWCGIPEGAAWLVCGRTRGDGKAATIAKGKRVAQTLQLDWDRYPQMTDGPKFNEEINNQEWWARNW